MRSPLVFNNQPGFIVFIEMVEAYKGKMLLKWKFVLFGQEPHYVMLLGIKYFRMGKNMLQKLES